MKYTIASLDAAILEILPISAKFPIGNGGVNRVSKMDLCVKHIFMYPDDFTSYASLQAIEIIRSAMLDLSKTGSLNYE